MAWESQMSFSSLQGCVRQVLDAEHPAEANTNERLSFSVKKDRFQPWRKKDAGHGKKPAVVNDQT